MTRGKCRDNITSLKLRGAGKKKGAGITRINDSCKSNKEWFRC